MKKINLSLATFLLNSFFVNAADFTVQGAYKSPGRFNATTIIAGIALIIIILILVYLSFRKKTSKKKLTKK